MTATVTHLNHDGAHEITGEGWYVADRWALIDGPFETLDDAEMAATVHRATDTEDHDRATITQCVFAEICDCDGWDLCSCRDGWHLTDLTQERVGA